MITIVINLTKLYFSFSFRFFILVILFCIFVFSANAQTDNNTTVNANNCKTPKVLELNPNGIFKVESISDKLASWTSLNGNKFPLENSEATILNCIKDLNKQIEITKQKIVQNIGNFNVKLNDLIENQDLTKLEEQIKAKVKSLSEIKDEFKTQLQSIHIKSVYGIVLNISAEEDITAAEQLNMARNFVASKAIEDINGILIKSLQTLHTTKEQTELIEWVEQNIQGNMEMDPSYTIREEINEHEKKLFIITVKVYPFKPQSTVSADKLNTPNGSYILKGVSESDFIGIQFLPGKKEKIFERINEFVKNANEENAVNQQEKLNIINTFSNKINDIQAEITLNYNKLNRRKENMKNIFQELGISYNLNNLYVSLKEAENIIRDKIQQAQSSLVQLNEQLWEIPQTTNVSLSGERRRDDIANNIKSVLDRLNQSGKVTIYENKQTLKNGAFNEQSNQNLYATRKINLLWVFLVKSSDNASWEVYVIGKYKYQVLKDDGTVLQRKQLSNEEINEQITHKSNEKNASNSIETDEYETKKKSTPNTRKFVAIKFGTNNSNTNVIVKAPNATSNEIPELISPYNPINTTLSNDLAKKTYLLPDNYSDFFIAFCLDHNPYYQFEIQYAQTGSSFTNNEALKINQLRLINNVRLHLIKNYWTINLGLSLDLNLSVKYKDIDLSKNTASTLFGYGIGTEISFSKSIGIGTTFFSQFSNLLNTDNGTKFVPTNLQTYLVIRF